MANFSPKVFFPVLLLTGAPSILHRGNLGGKAPNIRLTDLQHGIAPSSSSPLGQQPPSATPAQNSNPEPAVLTSESNSSTSLSALEIQLLTGPTALTASCAPETSRCARMRVGQRPVQQEED